MMDVAGLLRQQKPNCSVVVDNCHRVIFAQGSESSLISLKNEETMDEAPRRSNDDDDDDANPAAHPVDYHQLDDDDAGDNNQSDKNDTRQDCDDSNIWGSGGGYTPLVDVTSTNLDDNTPSSSSSMWVSMGPSSHSLDGEDGSTPEDGGGGAFFADAMTFRRMLRQEQEEGGDDDDDDHKGRGNSTDKPMEPMDDEAKDILQELDYRAIADQALMALDAEYQSVVDRAVITTEASPPPNKQSKEEEDANIKLPPIRLVTEEFGNDYFVADFNNETIDGATTSDNEEQQRPSPLLPDIDVDAVKRAVQAIQLRDGGTLQSNLEQWEIQQRRLHSLPPCHHSIIPNNPLQAFRKDTSRAISASARLSRAATIAEALQRLDLLQSQSHFHIDIIGCDHVECSSEPKIRSYFEPLVQWIGSYAESPQQVTISLIGPNVPSTAPPQVKITTNLGRLQSAQLFCRSTAYDGSFTQACPTQARTTTNVDDDVASSPSSTVKTVQPNLIVSFHAGIWGYHEWRPTLQQLASSSRRSENARIPLVVTAYTLQEAQDDADVVMEMLQNCNGKDATTTNKNELMVVWQCEMNPFASKQVRETATAPDGRIYRENAAWSCWRL